MYFVFVLPNSIITGSSEGIIRELGLKLACVGVRICIFASHFGSRFNPHQVQSEKGKKHCVMVVWG